MNFNSITIYLVLLLTTQTTLGQDTLKVKTQYPTLLFIKNIGLTANNPAALTWNNFINYGEAEVGFNNNEGSYKPVLSGSNKSELYLKAYNYYVFNKSVAKVNFRYENTVDKGVNYSNSNNSYRLTPYLFVDTILNDKITRESYKLKIKWATQLSRKISLGTLIKYKVESSAQNKDPRAENKIVQLKVKPGIIVQFNKFKIGYDFHYQYYNEEINLLTIKNNSSHRLYALTGLGTYSSHEASTFSRLYKYNNLGTNVQLLSKNNSFNVGFKRFKETTDDGRKGGDALWSAIKNDSELNGYSLKLDNKYLKQINNTIHSIETYGKITHIIGTEILQNLEVVNNKFYQWVTYSKEDKYETKLYTYSLSYQLVQLKTPEKVKQIFSINSQYNQNTENYYVPDSYIKFKNLTTKINYQKFFYIKNNELNTKLSVAYNKNLSRAIHIENNSVISNKIIYPEYYFNTSDYRMAEIELKYTFHPLFIRNSTYFKTKFTRISASSGVFKTNNRHMLNMALGVMF